MKTNNFNGENEDLPVLQHWQVNAPLPLRFQDHVWRRIASSEARKSVSFRQGWLDWYHWLAARPAMAVAYASVFLLVGSAAGFFQAKQMTARFNGALESRYVQTVDPYQPRE